MIVLDSEQIDKLIDRNEMMDQIEEAYKIFKAGDYYMPPRPCVEDANKTMMYMPCYTKEVIGTKILSIFPDNAKLGLPSIDGIMYLNDSKTGKPLAVMDGQRVTAWRTGAVGGVGHPAFIQKRLSYSRNRRSRCTGILSGVVCMCGKTD